MTIRTITIKRSDHVKDAYNLAVNDIVYLRDSPLDRLRRIKARLLIKDIASKNVTPPDHVPEPQTAIHRQE